MKKILIFMAVLLLGACTTLLADDRRISPDNLPAAAKTFIQQHFPERTIAYAEKDGSFTRITYEVHLSDGTEIEFKSNGEWDKVDCKFAPVPAALVPASIAEYVETTFPGTNIVKIDKERYGWDVELGNDLELKFSQAGKLLYFDD